MQNIGITDAIGVDAGFTVSHQIEEWYWLIAGNFTYNRSVDKTDPTSLSYDNQIPYTPWVSANGTIAVGFKGYVISSNALYSGERYSLNENIPINYLNSFLDWNVGVEKAFNFADRHVLDFNFKVMNLLNKNYEVIRSFPMPGRYYQLTLRYSFQ